MLLRRVRTVFGQFSQLSRLRKPLFLLQISRMVLARALALLAAVTAATHHHHQCASLDIAAFDFAHAITPRSRDATTGLEVVCVFGAGNVA